VADGDLLIQIAALAFLLLLSAFFSGSETALFSLNSLEKDSLRRGSSGRKARFVQQLFSQPDEILATVLTGNMFVNIFASSIAEALGVRLFSEAAELLSIASMTLLLLIVGEMTPKNLAIRHSLKFAHGSASFLRLIHAGLRPISYPLGKLRRAVLSALPKHGPEGDAEQGDAVLSAIRMGYQSKTIEESELRLLERFFRFRQKTAADVMVPRVDLHPVDAVVSINDLVQTLHAAGPAGFAGSASSLIPVFRHDLDHITGYVRRVDLVAHRLEPGTGRLSDISRPIHAVPASKRLRELLEEMSELGAEMSVVVDEYGGTEGVVSFPGLVAYLFEDFLPENARSIEQTGPATYRIAGHVDVDEVASALGVELSGHSRTVAGMILDQLGEFPTEGDEVSLVGYTFRVSGVTHHRISWLDVRKDRP
jgi:magnesium and cobalt exporter, CNNM family